MQRKAASLLIALGGTAAVTAIGRAMNLNPSTMGFAFLLVVLFASLRGRLLAGMAASIAATLCYNFFFFPPLYTFAIHDTANWLALATFLITSVVVSRLLVAIEDNAHVRALRESEMLRTSLLRAISHDLTTPLTAITIHTEALRRKAERDEELKATVAGIAGETGRLHRRIDNLLSMARLEAGRAKPRREPTPPADLFHAVRENLPLVFDHRPVTVHVDDDCPDANVDPSLALEILVNLIENAHRVSPQGAAIELTARAQEAMVRIEVLDRGPGMPTAIADTDVAQRGLGLEIARSLAIANGGRLDLVPRDGGGTIAQLDVPAAPPPLERA
jgi:two-component system, OmpR family, sensor histidine kinase KdpD